LTFKVRELSTANAIFCETDADSKALNPRGFT
jgi:hypothetical protein